MKAEITNLDLNKKAVDISKDYDLPDEMKVRLEMDIVKLAWGYHQSQLQALKEEIENKELSEMTACSEDYNRGYMNGASTFKAIVLNLITNLEDK